MPELKDILKSINQTKDPDLIDEFNENDYVPFVVNRCLSFFPDTIMTVNEMNLSPNLPKYMQYKYYLYGIKKKSRYSPWLKASKIPNVDLIQTYYNVSYKKAKEMLPLFSDNDIEQIKKELDKGG